MKPDGSHLPYRDLSYAVRRGYERIPSVLIWQWCVKQAGKRKRLRAFHIALTLLLAPIVAFIGSEVARGKSPWTLLLLWLLSFSALQGLMLWAAHTTWYFVGQRSSYLDLNLRRDAVMQATSWLTGYYSSIRQGAVSVATAGTLAGYLWMNRDQFRTVVPVEWISYLSLAMTGLIGANVLYWLWSAPGIVARLVRAQALELRWWAPATTPSIRLLSDAMGVAALFLAYGASFVVLSSFILPSAMDIDAIRNLLLAIGAIVLILSIRISLVPFIWIYRAVMTQKRSSMAYLMKDIPQTISGVRLTQRDVEAIQAYQAIASSPTMPFSTGAVVQYVGVLVGSLIGLVVSVMVK